jgi:hypothetical protein
MVGRFDGVRDRGRGLACVVSGHDGEKLIRPGGLTSSAACRAALDQAQAVGMAEGGRVSEAGPA